MSYFFITKSTNFTLFQWFSSDCFIILLIFEKASWWLFLVFPYFLSILLFKQVKQIFFSILLDSKEIFLKKWETIITDIENRQKIAYVVVVSSNIRERERERDIDNTLSSSDKLNLFGLARSTSNPILVLIFESYVFQLVYLNDLLRNENKYSQHF